MTAKHTVCVAGPDFNRLAADYAQLVATDEHFILATLQASWGGLQEALRESEPALLVLEAEVAPGPDPLRDLLGGLKRAVVILLLPAHWADLQGVFEQLDRVRLCLIQPVVPREVLARGLGLVETELARTRAAAPLQEALGAGTTGAVGTRVIAFVSAQGGVGRSTLAEAVGFELAARRRIHALLLSFDLPACAPLRLGIRLAPSASEFLMRSQGGFSDCLQTTADGLDVIIAPPESTAYAAAQRPGDQARIHELVNHAFHQSYAALLLDLPAGESAWMLQPLRAANTVVLVSRPTTEGVLACGHVMRLLTEVLGREHRIARTSFFLVLNRRTPKSIYTAPAFAGELAKHAGWNPPVLAVVEEDPEVGRAQESARPAGSACESLGRAAATLVETLYGQGGGPVSRAGNLPSRLFGRRPAGGTRW